MKSTAWLGCIMLLLVCPLTVIAAEIQDVQPDPSIDQFLNERYSYAIDFLIFKSLATGELSLEATDQPDVFRAVLVGRTIGAAAWLTSQRTQSYVSLMQLQSDGHLHSIEHVSRVLKRKRGIWKDRGKRYRFDYVRKKVFQEKARNGLYRPGKVFELPDEGEPVDILTAFYNLRLGVYGPLVHGARFRVPTFSSKGLSDILIDVLTPEEQAKQRFFSPGGLLVRARIDPEVFDTKSGDLYVWFSASGVPEMGIVEDVIGMGDVRGTLEEKTDESAQ